MAGPFPFDPLAPVGMLTAPTVSPGVSLGTCYLFRHEYVALTASHCVPDDIELHLEFPRLERTRLVTSIERHPTADIAALLTEGTGDGDQETSPPSAFWDRVSNWGLGEPFSVFGFPVEGPWTGQLPIPRLFSGTYQRFFEYSSPDARYRYLAGEMSLPAPAGLSGAPVFRPEAPMMLTGMVTANLETATTVDHVVTMTTDGEESSHEVRRVISYGIGLMLSEVSDWLKGVVPPRAGLGWTS